MKSVAKSIIYRIVAGIGMIILISVRYAMVQGTDEEFQASDLFYFWYLLAFLSCVLLGSAFIDFIRVETNWLPVIKGIAYVVIFLIAFAGFLIAVFILEYIR